MSEPREATWPPALSPAEAQLVTAEAHLVAPSISPWTTLVLAPVDDQGPLLAYEITIYRAPYWPLSRTGDVKQDGYFYERQRKDAFGWTYGELTRDQSIACIEASIKKEGKE